jgi:hypothetical protein
VTRIAPLAEDPAVTVAKTHTMMLPRACAEGEGQCVEAISVGAAGRRVRWSPAIEYPSAIRTSMIAAVVM